MRTTLAIALLLAAPTIRRVGEAGVRLFLLVLPFLPLALLFGVSEITPELSIVARLNGAALLAIDVTSWLTRREEQGSAQVGLLVGLLIYDGPPQRCSGTPAWS